MAYAPHGAMGASSTITEKADVLGAHAARPGFTESRHRHTCGLIWPLKWHLLPITSTNMSN